MTTANYYVETTVEFDSHECPARKVVRANDAPDAIRRACDIISLDYYESGMREIEFVSLEARRVVCLPLTEQREIAGMRVQ